MENVSSIMSYPWERYRGWSTISQSFDKLPDEGRECLVGEAILN
jgi:hypothetical protein